MGPFIILNYENYDALMQRDFLSLEESNLPESTSIYLQIGETNVVPCTT